MLVVIWCSFLPDPMEVSTSTLPGVLLQAITFMSVLVLGWALLLAFVFVFSFVRGKCSACNGRGHPPLPPQESPFIFRKDIDRLQPGKCRKCAYDLTGNTSGRCPECGTAIL